MNKVLEYAVLCCLSAAFAFWVATSVGNAINASLEKSAALIERSVP